MRVRGRERERERERERGGGGGGGVERTGVEVHRMLFGLIQSVLACISRCMFIYCSQNSLKAC